MQTSTIQWIPQGETRVPLAVYRDDQVFADEQRNIYRGDTWNYLCLENEIPESGDYRTTFVGETPVVVARDADGEIYAFENRCTHRGALICLEKSGKDAKDFQCVYHAWTYSLKGDLKGVAFEGGVNGAGGIAVGMATNIPPHNLGEIIDATVALIDNPELDLAGLAVIVQGPDFPTGAIILGRNGILQAYREGRGSIIVRSKTHFEEIRGRTAIIVDEVPYQVNKARMVERIAEVYREKKVEGIADLRDESDRHGVRVVIEVKREADPDIVLNQLFKFTPLQTSFGINMVSLRGGRPEQLGLKEMLEAFIGFREEVILRRTAFDLAEARRRAHIVVGLVVAVANIDEIIALIRAAADPQEAKAGLMARAWPLADVLPLIRLIEQFRPGGGNLTAMLGDLSGDEARVGVRGAVGVTTRAFAWWPSWTDQGSVARRSVDIGQAARLNRAAGGCWSGTGLGDHGP